MIFWTFLDALGRRAGWGARIRTWEWRNQNPLPYRLATPQTPVTMAPEPAARRNAADNSSRSCVPQCRLLFFVAGAPGRAAPCFERQLAADIRFALAGASEANG